MKNKINNLGNGFIEMICEDTLDRKNISVYFNEDLLEHIRSYNVEWKSWSINRKNKVDKFIGAAVIVNGKKANIQLKRIIGAFLYGDGKKFSILNGNHNDLRSYNIFPYEGNNFYKEDIQRQMNVLKSGLPSIESIINQGNTITPNTANIESDSVRVYEQDDKVTIIDLQKDDFIFSIEKKYINAIINKFSSRL